MRMRTWGIGAKMLISNIILGMTVTLCVCLLASALQFFYVEDMLTEDLKEKARNLADMVLVDQDGMRPPNAQDMRDYQKLINGIILYIDSNSMGYHLQESSSAENAEATVQREDFREILDEHVRDLLRDGQEFSLTQRIEWKNSVLLAVGVPIRDAEHHVAGGVIVAQPISVFEKMSGMMRVMVYYAAGIAIILAIILAIALAMLLARPIRRITQTAQSMADGQYTARTRIVGSDEIGQLGSVLNTLCERLSGSIERMREERDKLELIIASIGEGILAVDANKNVVHVNQAFLELMEDTSAEAVLRRHDEQGDALRQLLDSAIGGGKREQGKLCAASGRNILAIASPFFDKGGKIVGAVVLLRDVSQEERLEQLRKDYVANISHELRTPLTGIRGMVEPLMDGIMETEEERADCYKVIYQETLRLEKLVGEMLDMSRLQDGRITLELEMLELPGILESAVRRMRPLAEKCGIHLSWETDNTKLACFANENRIAQVLTIFMDNALSFTPERGSVRVYAKDNGETVLVGVRDTGVGIEPKDLPFIWERFYKADKSRLRTTGTGLGLAIAKLVVELMGGEIGVHSKIGEGSEFYFTLPKKEKSAMNP